MTTRSNAKTWLSKTHPSEIANPTRVSKYYSEQELWFFTFPTSFLYDKRPGYLVMLLEDQRSTTSFHLLKVPFAFFHENRAKFDIRKEGDKFDLHISAKKPSWLSDLRSDSVEFSKFCV